MIFYFSATGNSKYAAERLAAATEDRVVFLRDAIRSRSYRYDIGREERVGFVVPVYFQGLPSILHFFLKKLASGRETRRARWRRCWRSGGCPSLPGSP